MCLAKFFDEEMHNVKSPLMYARKQKLQNRDQRAECLKQNYPAQVRDKEICDIIRVLSTEKKTSAAWAPISDEYTPRNIDYVETLNAAYTGNVSRYFPIWRKIVPKSAILVEKGGELLDRTELMFRVETRDGKQKPLPIESIIRRVEHVLGRGSVTCYCVRPSQAKLSYHLQPSRLAQLEQDRSVTSRTTAASIALTQVLDFSEKLIEVDPIIYQAQATNFPAGLTQYLADKFGDYKLKERTSSSQFVFHCSRCRDEDKVATFKYNAKITYHQKLQQLHAACPTFQADHRADEYLNCAITDRLTCIKARMGSGKTQNLARILTVEEPNCTAVMISVRRTLAFDYMKRYRAENSLPFESYMDLTAKQISIHQHPRLVIQVDSLGRLDVTDFGSSVGARTIRYLVLDEVESLLNQVKSTDDTRIVQTLCELMTHADHVVAMDGLLQQSTVRMLEAMMSSYGPRQLIKATRIDFNKDMPAYDVKFVEASFRQSKENRGLTFLTDSILRLLRQDKCVACFMSGRNVMESIRQFVQAQLPDIHIVTFSGKDNEMHKKEMSTCINIVTYLLTVRDPLFEEKKAWYEMIRDLGMDAESGSNVQPRDVIIYHHRATLSAYHKLIKAQGETHGTANIVRGVALLRNVHDKCTGAETIATLPAEVPRPDINAQIKKVSAVIAEQGRTEKAIARSGLQTRGAASVVPQIDRSIVLRIAKEVMDTAQRHGTTLEFSSDEAARSTSADEVIRILEAHKEELKTTHVVSRFDVTKAHEMVYNLMLNAGHQIAKWTSARKQVDGQRYRVATFPVTKSWEIERGHYR
ncbi:hypothetical protein PAPYR_13113 [Paratrimastix pyriformis]|uniref:Replication origin-binding protein domain-containing protein n=1 Tax=Paratrimastix pyriformis TaxID=342808 RepID=A0ABQ8U0T3_9EUKA|nr:hypothetical protein PAPYR_13113 [Paratrimastix pyriformis]